MSYAFPKLYKVEERPGRAIAGGTAGGLHVQHLRGVLSAELTDMRLAFTKKNGQSFLCLEQR